MMGRYVGIKICRYTIVYTYKNNPNLYSYVDNGIFFSGPNDNLNIKQSFKKYEDNKVKFTSKPMVKILIFYFIFQNNSFSVYGLLSNKDEFFCSAHNSHRLIFCLFITISLRIHHTFVSYI